MATSSKQIILPATCDDLFGKLLEDGSFQRHHENNSMDKLSPMHKAFVKYGFNALKIGRPLNKCLIVMFGKTGTGKSTTINRLFEDDNLCPTNESTSETRIVKEYSKKLNVTAQNTNIEGYLTFLDVPGTLDVDQSREASNFLRVKSYRESNESLCSRKLQSVPAAFRRIVCSRIYPNLLLLATTAPDTRVMGPDSDFCKTLKALSHLDLVDRENLNLIVVVTMAMSIPRRTYKINVKKIELRLQDVVYTILRLKDVPIIFVENLPEDNLLDKAPNSDFYELPNGDLSHFNLMSAFEKLFQRNNDLLGALFSGWYFNSECPEKSHDVIVNTPLYEEVPESVIHKITSTLKTLGLIQSKDAEGNIIPSHSSPYYFSMLGHGYCPVTETVKHQNLLQESTGHKEIVIEGKKYIVPNYLVKISNGAETNFQRLTFESRAAYQRHRSAQYGLSAGINLIVQTSANGRWINEAGEGNCRSLLSLRQQAKLATFSIKHPKQLLTKPFAKLLENLPRSFEESNLHEFYNFFSKFGTHLIVTQSLGGEILYDCKISAENYNENRGQQIQNRIGGIFQNGLDGNANVRQDNNGMELFGISEQSLRVRGGNPDSVDFVERIECINPIQLQKWRKSISESIIELQDGFQLVPYYELIEDRSRAITLKQATYLYLQDRLPQRQIVRRNELAERIVNDVANRDLERLMIRAVVVAIILGAMGLIAKTLKK